ncbi:MAG: hypothetical protein JW863_22015 [Chitinispirillaceae bacterium]|nr:hypothetical protein [Chitinispirillaceae bacterium]
MRPFNTATYAATRNWMDLGLVYQYRIINGSLEMKQSDEAWRQLPLPGGREPLTVAADNNRCLVLTTGNELWWYCARHDQAQWSIDIMQTAVDILALKPAIGDDLCGILLPHLVGITDSVAVKASRNRYLKSWDRRDHGGSEAYWQRKCKAYLDGVPGIDGLLLKSGNGTSFTAAAYADWSRRAHEEGAWSNLLTWNDGDSAVTFTRGNNVSVDSISDIAIGHWNGTVVTTYVLAMGKVWFIDEELIHPEWKPIEQWNNKWSAFGKEYRPILNSPYPLDTACRIDASNSVIAVAKPADTSVSLFWLRWDYHQKDDFVYWPIDWCEHEWRPVSVQNGKKTCRTPNKRAFKALKENLKCSWLSKKCNRLLHYSSTSVVSH